MSDPMGYPHHDRVQEILREMHVRYKHSSRMETDNELYKELVGFGQEVVPVLLYRLDRFEAPWDGLAIWESACALHDITGVNVIRKGEEGRLKEVIKRWLDWGEEQGLHTRIEWDD